MTKDEFQQRVFLELLRTYHNGIGVTHAAEPQDEVGSKLAKEAAIIVQAYYEDNQYSEDK